MSFKKISLKKRHRKKRIKKAIKKFFGFFKNPFAKKQSIFKIHKKKKLLSALVISLMVVFGGMAIYSMSKTLYQKFANFSFKDVIVDIVGKELPKDENGYTNILIMGIGGKWHQGGELTDTLIVASIDKETNSVVMLSVPRDFYVETEATSSRINEILRDAPKYYQKQGYSDEKSQELALKTLDKKITELTGLEIHKYAKIDFQGFVKIIDALGGIEVDVERTIDDPAYPDNNWGYERFYLQAGKQKLDGETALKYARSRHDSSDFDRAKRQQKILEAIREKSLSLGILTSPEKISNIFNIIDENFTSDLSLQELVTLAGFASNFDRNNMFSHVLNDDQFSEGGFLVTPDRSLYGGAFVLVPYLNLVEGHKYDQIKLFSEIIFQNRYLSLSPPQIEIANGTNISGLARELMYHLNRYGIPISRIYTSDEKLEKTVIIYKKDNQNQKITNLLQKLFRAELKEQTNEAITATTENTEQITEEKEPNIITIIIGSDYKTFRIPE